MEMDELLYYGGMIVAAAALILEGVSLLFIRYRRARMELRLTKEYGDSINMYGAENPDAKVHVPGAQVLTEEEEETEAVETTVITDEEKS